MPRDGSGNYSVPNTFLPNTVMSATAVNANFTDAGAEITNSLARDGQSAMSGQFKAIDGTVGAPGISFGQDPDTGFRRWQANSISWVAAGADVLFHDTVNLQTTLNFFALGNLTISGALSGAGVPDLVALEALSGNGAARRIGANTWALDDGTFSIGFTKDNVGNVLTTGPVCDIRIQHACVLTGWTLLADQAGSVVVDVWKDTFANYPPTVADTITAAAKPTLSGVNKNEDTTLSGWTTTVNAGDTIRFNIDSVATITRLMLLLRAKRFT